MNEQSKIEDGQICSIDILNRLGISRATLNNYINKGLIPHPVVKKPDNITIKAKRIGYFPFSILTTLELIKQYKKEGFSMNEICNLMTRKANESSEIVNNIEGQIKNEETLNRICETSQRTMYESSDDVKVTINDLHCPAYLINNNFEIEWINSLAEKNLFGRSIRSIKIAESRNIFGLFITMGLLQSRASNRDTIIDHHMTLYKQKHSKESLKILAHAISAREIELLMDIYDNTEQTSEDIHSRFLSVKQPDDGMKTAYRVFNIVFREGILCIYVPTDSEMQEIADLLSRRGKVIQDLLKQRMPTLCSFSVLVADLQDSIRICAELPPEEYFILINQIWKCMEGSFKKYYGTYGKHSGDGMVYYFLKDHDSNYLMNAIRCAIELRERMKILSSEWKINKGWFNDLYLNVGINEGQEYFGTIPAAPSIEFTALGDSVNYAGRLSDFARFGAIWTTKNLVTRLDEEDRKKILYGVNRREQNRDILIENIFSRMVDLMPQESPKYSKFMDIATLPVTEIHNFR